MVIEITLHNMRTLSVQDRLTRFVDMPWAIRCDRLSEMGNFEGRGISREEAIKVFRAKASLAMTVKDMQLAKCLRRAARIGVRYGFLELWCWCVPLPCHTEVIRDAILDILDGGDRIRGVDK